MFNKLNVNRISADDGPDNERMMIRRKLISDDQVLVNDSEESEEVVPVAASYVNVMVSWLRSDVVVLSQLYVLFEPIFIHFY